MSILTKYRRPKKLAAMVFKSKQRWDWATIHRVDGDRVSIRIRNSPNIIRNVAVSGDIRSLRIGDVVPVSWSDARPIVSPPVKNVFEKPISTVEDVEVTTPPSFWSVFFTEAECPEGMANTVNSSQMYSGYWVSSSAADGDVFSFYPYINAGSYLISILGAQSTNRGKMDTYFDGQLIYSGQDWYAASPTLNVVVEYGVLCSYPGNHLLQLVMNGKNASSSSYALGLTKISLISRVYA